MTTWRSGLDYAFLGDGVLVVYIQDIGRMIRMRPDKPDVADEILRLRAERAESERDALEARHLVATARRDALEEAAQIADRYRGKYYEHDKHGQDIGAEIRALAAQPQRGAAASPKLSREHFMSSDSPLTDAELRFHELARSDGNAMASGMTMFARRLERCAAMMAEALEYYAGLTIGGQSRATEALAAWEALTRG